MANIQLSWELNEGALLTGLAKIEDRLNAIEGELKDVEEAGKDAFDKTGTNVKKLDNNLKKSQNGIFGTVNVMQKLTNAATIGFGALVAGATAAGVRAVNLAKNYEQTLVSFTTFLGSAQQARAVLAELEQFSLSTPFEPRQVQEAGKALLAFGIEADKLSPTLRAIGDLAAGTGKDFNELAVIYGKARTQGTLFAEDINQLTEAGIPIIAEFAEQFGVTEGEVKKLGSEGRIQFSNLERAFQSLTGEGGQFFNLMQNQSQTLAGQISTLRGNFDNLLRRFAGGNNIIKDLVGSLNEWLTVTTDQKEELRGLQVELNRELNILQNANLTQDARNQIIKEVNEKYGEYLPNLISEKDTLEDIARLQEASNKLFQQRILYVAYEEDIAKALEETKKAFQLAVGFEIAANRTRELVREEARTGDVGYSPSQLAQLEEQANTFSQVSEGLRGQVRSQEDVINEVRATYDAVFKSLGIGLDEFEKKFNKVGDAINQNNKETELNAKELEEIIKKYEKLTDQLEKTGTQARLGLGSQTQQVLSEYEFTLEQIDNLKNEIIDLSKLTGKPLPSNFADSIANAIALAQQELEQRIAKIREETSLGDILTIREIEEQTIQEENEKRLKDITDNAVKSAKQALENAQKEAQLRQTFSPFLKYIQSTFGLTGEQAQQVEAQAQLTFNKIVEGLDFSTQLQITQQDQLISKLDERIQKQQELIDKEAQLAEEGYANNLDAEKANLDALNKERQRAAERRNEIERNAANRTLAIDAATQASRLTSTAIELFAGQARFGLPGILFAASALATLFSLIARARAQAQQFAQPVELRGGGLFDGPNLLSHESQRRTGKHHRIEGSNMAIEKGEWIIGTKHSKEHGSFLEALNAGKYSGIDLQESLAIAQTLNKRGRKVRAGADSVAVQSIIKRASGYDALQKKLDGVISSVEAVQAEVRRRPVVIPAGRSQVVTDDGIRREVKLIDVK